MASKKNKTTVFTTNYVYCVYGGAIKVGLSHVRTGATHPETVLEDLKKYYGNEIKGYYCKTVDSLESISTKLEEELKDKNGLSQYLYEVKVTDIKKIIKTVADSKTGTTMGPPKQKATEDDDDEESEEDEKVEVAKKITKAKDEKDTKEKDTKEKDTKVKDTKAKDEKKVDVKKVVIKDTKDVKEIKKVDTKKKVTKEDPVETKSNKTVIELSDDSDDEEED
jgi:hypothetical protein